MIERVRQRIVRRAAAAALTAACAATWGASAVDRMEPAPKELEDVGVDEKLDGAIPLDAPFVDETGKAVTIGTYLAAGKPVLLTLNYYRCPMLCTLVLNGLVDGLKELSWIPGGEFEMVTVSIDPSESPTLAAAKKRSYVEAYERPAAAAGWHFLTGKPEAIRAITESVGFRYTYDAERNEYAHAAVVILIKPDGRVSRYLYGVQFEPKDLRLALLEASQGRIGNTLDRIILHCYYYDSQSRQYSIAAMRVMQLGAGLTLAALGALMIVLWTREARRRRAVA